MNHGSPKSHQVRQEPALRCLTPKLLRQAAQLIASGKEKYMCWAIAAIADRWPEAEDEFKERCLYPFGISTGGDLDWRPRESEDWRSHGPHKRDTRVLWLLLMADMMENPV